MRVGQLGADGQHEALGEAVRPRAPRRDLDYLDARIRIYRVERGGELAGPMADEEPEPPDVLAEVHDKVAGLLAEYACPGSLQPGQHRRSRARRDVRSRPGRAGSGRRPRVSAIMKFLRLEGSAIT